jgi:hypothetical protein
LCICTCIMCVCIFPSADMHVLLLCTWTLVPVFLQIKPCNGRRPDSIRGNRSAYVFWVLVE